MEGEVVFVIVDDGIQETFFLLLKIYLCLHARACRQRYTSAAVQPFKCNTYWYKNSLLVLCISLLVSWRVCVYVLMLLVSFLLLSVTFLSLLCLDLLHSSFEHSNSDTHTNTTPLFEVVTLSYQ